MSVPLRWPAREDIGYPRVDHHLARLLAIALAHVASRRAAPARRQPNKFHAELVEVTVAAGEFFLDLNPQFVERHHLADESDLFKYHRQAAFKDDYILSYL